MEKKDQPEQREWAGRHELHKRLWGEQERRLRKARRRRSGGDADESLAEAPAPRFARE